jgi:RimJ/RimL family protein N-acetyltransferase
MTTSWTHETERYRYAGRDDLPAFTELLTDPEVGRWLWFTPIQPAGVEQFFGPLLDRQTGEIEAGKTPLTAVFVVEDLDGAFLGQGAVVEVPMSPRGFEIGFQLARKAWGRGVGTRLGRFLCAYAIEVGDAYRIEAGCLAENVGSAALLRKLGLELEGTLPGYRLKEDVRHTELHFGVEVHRLDGADPRLRGLRVAIRNRAIARPGTPRSS